MTRGAGHDVRRLSRPGESGPGALTRPLAHWALATGQKLTGGRFGYTGRARTTGRALDRAARALATPALWRSPAVVRCYWWEQVKNFGDLITPYLLRNVGIVPTLTTPQEADLVGVGSLVQHLDDDYVGTIWGAGIVADERRDIPGATTLALRGELTRSCLGDPRVEALGDPGLLLSEHITRRTPRFDVGVVPHYVHVESPEIHRLLATAESPVTVVNVQQDPIRVARHIASCRTIVTTSLHGLIVADSLGIPALWVRMPRALFGGDFKFHDHETVVRPQAQRGVDVGELGSLREAVSRAVAADADAVARAKDRLIRSGAKLLEVTPYERLPLPSALARTL